MTNGTLQKSRQLIIIGAGGHAVSVANIALSAGFLIYSFVDSIKAGQTLLGVKVITNIADVDNFDEYSFALAIGDNATRLKFYEETVANFGQLKFPVLIHRSAVVSEFSTVDVGTVIMPQAVIGPNSRVEKFCLINTQASIDHDCLMRDFSSLAPGAITGGNVEIGSRSAISIGARLRHGVKVGDDVVVGANSYVNSCLPNNVVCYGTPAKIIRSRKMGEPYLN